MVRRRAKKRSRRTKSFSVINALEAYTYASILSEGIFSTNPVEFLLGEGDVAPSSSWTQAGLMGSSSWLSQNIHGGAAIGADAISLRDIIKDPSFSLAVSSIRARQSMVTMIVQSAMTGIAFRFGKRLLRRPISSVNRNIMTPLLGKAVRL